MAVRRETRLLSSLIPYWHSLFFRAQFPQVGRSASQRTLESLHALQALVACFRFVPLVLLLAVILSPR